MAQKLVEFNANIRVGDLIEVSCLLLKTVVVFSGAGQAVDKEGKTAAAHATIYDTAWP